MSTLSREERGRTLTQLLNLVFLQVSPLPGLGGGARLRIQDQTKHIEYDYDFLTLKGVKKCAALAYSIDNDAFSLVKKRAVNKCLNILVTIKSFFEQ